MNIEVEGAAENNSDPRSKSISDGTYIEAFALVLIYCFV
jgi:hypothetical protein